MLDGIPIAALTAPTLLGFAVLMLLLGKIVPRATLVDKAEEAERWRKAYEAEREARVISDAQTAELLELAKTTHNILVAMFGTTERVRVSATIESEGASDVVPTTK
jgi:hypothetical protein